jgi:hypothetical protein
MGMNEKNLILKLLAVEDTRILALLNEGVKAEAAIKLVNEREMVLSATRYMNQGTSQFR